MLTVLILCQKMPSHICWKKFD